MDCGNWTQFLEEQDTPKVAKPSLQSLSIHRRKMGMELCKLSCGRSIINPLRDFPWLLSVLREACFSINRNKCSWNHLKGRQGEERRGLLSLVTQIDLCGIWASWTGLKICLVILPWKLLSFPLWLDVLAPILREEASCKCSCRWMNIWYWWANPEGPMGRMAGQCSKVWKRSLEIPEHWQKSSGHWLLPLLKAGWVTLPKFMGRFMRASVFVLHLIFTDCSAVVFISFIPAVAQGIFWQPGPPGQLGIAC